MSLALQIAPHLPYLRRYARALTGSQNGGDAYVTALLEAIVADPQGIEKKHDLRVGLYTALCQLWESVAYNMKSDQDVPDWEVVAGRRLSAIRSRAREAFLLHAVEGFSKPQIREILECNTQEVEDLLEEASNAILDGVKTDVMIIEDEPMIALDLEAIIVEMGHNVIGVATTEREAIRLSSGKRPGLILADIQLADGSSGVDAVNKIISQFQMPVVFITAFPEKLLTGVQPEPAFLITKPFKSEMVKAVVSQALFFDTKASMAA
jgi:DNA-directed RNA polymerase specialized sigma24 family protein/CheY-like chemotaxis protein